MSSPVGGRSATSTNWSRTGTPTAATSSRPNTSRPTRLRNELLAVAGAIPLQRLHHANVVVHDLQATARGYARLLGITRWQVRHHTPQRLQHTQARGYRMEFGYSTATGSNAHGVTFRLV